MATVSEIWVKVNADIKGLQSGLATSSAELKAFSATAAKTASTTTQAGQKLGGSFSGIGATLSKLSPAFIALGAAAVAGIVKGISATTQWASDVRSLQRVTGQTAESASALAGAAAQLGIPVSQLTTGFGLLAKNIVNNSASLTKYGIATRDAQGQILPFDDVLGAISDRFNALPTAMDKAAFAQNVFGRSGKQLIPILSQGRDGLAALEQKAADLHLVMGQDALDDAKNLSLAERELGLAFKGASISIGQAFIPAATAVVHVITTIVEVLASIPTPVKVAVLGFATLTGAVAGVSKIAGFFGDTWKGVLGVLGNTAQLGEAAQSATDAGDAISQTLQEAANLSNVFSAVRGSALAAAGPIGALATVQTAQADAAVLASLANTRYSQTVSGLIVPTEALAAAQAESTAASGGLLTLLGGAAPVLVGFTAVAGGLVAGFIRLRNAARESREAVAADILTLQEFGRRKGLQQIAASIAPGAPTPAATKEISEFVTGQRPITSPFAAHFAEDVGDAQAALARYTQQQQLTETGTKKLGTSIRSLVGAIEDGATPVADVTGLLDTLNESTNRLGGAFGQLSKVSGEDFGAIRDAVVKALNDPKTTVEQLPGIFQAALSKVKEDMKAWHDSIVENFGGASAAMSEFLGQAAGQGPNKVSFDNLTDSLKKTQAQLHTWSQDFATILHSSGDKAKTFLQDMSENGLDSIGILEVVAQQPKKIRDEFLRNYNDVNKSTNTIADQITTAFGKAADRIVLQLKNIVRAIQGLPPIKPKADTSAIDALIAKLRTAAILAYQVSQGQRPGQGTVSPRQTPHGGGLITRAGVRKFHAGGAVPRMHSVGGAPAVADAHSGSTYGVRPPPMRNGQMWMNWTAAAQNAHPAAAMRQWNDRLRGPYVRHGGNATIHVASDLSSELQKKHLGYTDFDLRHIHLSPIVKTVHDPLWNLLLMHEMGHGFGLGHVASGSNLMNKDLTGNLINPTQVQQVKKWFKPSTMHAGGLAADEVPAVLQVGEFVVQKRAVDRIGLSNLFAMNQMHSGGAVVPPGASPIGGAGMDEAALERAFVRALRTERERLYLDRKRFGRDLDHAVIADGRW